MNFTPVASTTLSTVACEDAGEILQLEFRSGAIYRYCGVPAAVHDGLLRASSKGRCFNEEIRERFRGVGSVTAGKV